MKIGYVGDSTIQKFQSARRFRLAGYSPKKFRESARLNLEGVRENILYSVENNFFFYRIRSEVIPFASHPVCQENWQEYFYNELQALGETIKTNNMRVSMHPDQFVVINSPVEKVVENSVRELQYHADLFSGMQLESHHKFQIHVGGVYGNKEESILRFVSAYRKLPEGIKKYLVIENDDKLFSVKDCYHIFRETGVPVLFDTFHHSLLNNGETVLEAMDICFSTWKAEDGVPMVDYSSQQEGFKVGRHADTLDEAEFQAFLAQVNGREFDIMFEIKDKDKSVLKARKLVG